MGDTGVKITSGLLLLFLCIARYYNMPEEISVVFGSQLFVLLLIFLFLDWIRSVNDGDPEDVMTCILLAMLWPVTLFIFAFAVMCNQHKPNNKGRAEFWHYRVDKLSEQEIESCIDRGAWLQEIARHQHITREQANRIQQKARDNAIKNNNVSGYTTTMEWLACNELISAFGYKDAPDDKTPIQEADTARKEMMASYERKRKIELEDSKYDRHVTVSHYTPGPDWP